MIFLTVGTLFPFDRLVKAVDITIAKNNGYEKVFAQIGKTNYEPKNIEYTAILENRNFDKKISDADYLISHAGIGTITRALELNKGYDQMDTWSIRKTKPIQSQFKANQSQSKAN